MLPALALTLVIRYELWRLPEKEGKVYSIKHHYQRVFLNRMNIPMLFQTDDFSALTLLVGHQEEHMTCKN